MLTVGHVQTSWHAGTVRPSPPMSIIKPAAGLITQLPMCAVFTMDPGSGFIINLAFYFDRWKLAHDKWDKNNPPHIDGGAAAATEFLGGLSAGVTCRFVSKLHAKVDWPCQALDTRHSMGLLQRSSRWPSIQKSPSSNSAKPHHYRRP